MKKIKINDDVSSLSHTNWNCQYHIVFTPKYRKYACKNSTQVKCIKIYGIFKGEKCINNI